MKAHQLTVVRQLPALTRSGNDRVARRYRRELRPAVVEIPTNEKSARRCDGVRVFSLSSLHRGEAKVPYLRLSGRWLEECGFAIGARIYLKAERGKLIVTTEDPGAAMPRD